MRNPANTFCLLRLIDARLGQGSVVRRPAVDGPNVEDSVYSMDSLQPQGLLQVYS